MKCCGIIACLRQKVGKNWVNFLYFIEIFFIFCRKSLRKVHITRIAYTINGDGFALFAKPFSTPWRKRLSCLVLWTTYPLYSLTVRSQRFLPFSISICELTTCSIKSQAISIKTPKMLLFSDFAVPRKIKMTVFTLLYSNWLELVKFRL